MLLVVLAGTLFSFVMTLAAGISLHHLLRVPPVTGARVLASTLFSLSCLTALASGSEAEALLSRLQAVLFALTLGSCGASLVLRRQTPPEPPDPVGISRAPR